MKSSVFVRTLGLVAGFCLTVGFSHAAFAETAAPFKDAQCDSLINNGKKEEPITIDVPCQSLMSATSPHCKFDLKEKETRRMGMIYHGTLTKGTDVYHVVGRTKDGSCKMRQQKHEGEVPN
jgi:hypothetical protein